MAKLKTVGMAGLKGVFGIGSLLVILANPLSYFAFFHWPKQAPRWRYRLEWTAVVLSMLVVVGLVVALVVRTSFG